jgi:hypothetical protein
VRKLARDYSESLSHVPDTAFRRIAKLEHGLIFLEVVIAAQCLWNKHLGFDQLHEASSGVLNRNSDTLTIPKQGSGKTLGWHCYFEGGEIL